MIEGWHLVELIAVAIGETDERRGVRVGRCRSEDVHGWSAGDAGAGGDGDIS
jgi:hypothetical protein